MDWIVFGALQIILLIQASTAKELGLWSRESMERQGIEKGLPFLWHGGMWGDLIILTPLLSYMSARVLTSAEASLGQLLVAWGAGHFASKAMHETYKQASWTEAHVMRGELTRVGEIHRSYMTVAIMIILLYVLRPLPADEFSALCVVAGLLVLHVVCGTHVVLGVLKRLQPARFGFYPGDPLRSMGTWGPILGVSMVAVLRVFWHSRFGY